MKLQTISSFDGTKLHVRYTNRRSAKNPPIILNDGLGCSGYAWKHLTKYFRDTHPIIEWNYRGHGKSNVPKSLGTMTIETLANDMIAVLDALKVDNAISVSHSMGVQVALEAYSLSPKRFAAKIFVCGGYKHPIATWHMAPERENRDTLANLAMKTFFGRGTRAMIDFPSLSQFIWKKVVASEATYQACVLFEVNHRRIKRDDFLPYFKGLESMQANVFGHIARSYATHSAQEVLHQIEHPTLIIGGGKDAFCPKWIKEDMHSFIRASELHMIEDGTHATPIEHPAQINRRIKKFLRDRVLPK